MKKVLLSLFVCGCVLSASAQVPTTTTTTTQVPGTSTTVTTTDHKYVYYPSTNVYYDPTSGNYWYQNTGATEWTQTQTLPSTITIEKTTPQVEVLYNGTDPYKNNAMDIKKYKVKKNGAVKIKPAN